MLGKTKLLRAKSIELLGGPVIHIDIDRGRPAKLRAGVIESFNHLRQGRLRQPKLIRRRSS